MLPYISFLVRQGPLFMRSWERERSAGRGKWPPSWPSSCRTSEVGGRSLSLSLMCVHVRVLSKTLNSPRPSAPAAMSSYLFIVKYELPEVIRSFLALEENSGWVCIPFFKQQQANGADPLTFWISLQRMVPEWQLPGGVRVYRGHSALVTS